MRVVKHIDVEVNHCSQCPYYSEDNDMGATMRFCEKIKSDDIYDKLLNESGFNPSREISDKCPYKNFEY